MRKLFKTKYFLLLLLLIGNNLFSNSVPSAKDEKTIVTDITKLSQLAPYLGKRIIVSGLIVYGSFGHDTKEFPYFLIDGNEKLHISLGVDGEFFKKLPTNVNRQTATISGLLSYYLIDLTLPQNAKFKKELANGDVCWSVPNKYGELELENIELIQITEEASGKTVIKEDSLTAKDKAISDPRFVADGNINKFKEYIQYLIENKN